MNCKIRQKIGLGIIAFSLICLLSSFSPVKSNDLESSFPPLQSHPLPLPLQNWQYQRECGDYFLKIEPHPVGYLIWSQFPLKVYVEQPNLATDESDRDRVRFQEWVRAVRKAIAEWNQYLPLMEVDSRENADITINRRHPPLKKAKIDPETGLYDLPRARSARTSVKFYLREGEQRLLLHRMAIDISPAQSDSYIFTAARHELGHALGIWGHSERETDVMYFSQVPNLTPISPRDVNTLQKIYQQPTRLGWSLKN